MQREFFKAVKVLRIVHNRDGEVLRIVMGELCSNEEAFFWLSDARIANVCYASTDPSVGLGLSMEQSSLKCYMADTGLLVTLAPSMRAVGEEDVYRAVLRGQIGLNEGMLTENVVAQALRANGHRLFFYSQSGKKMAKSAWR